MAHYLGLSSKRPRRLLRPRELLLLSSRHMPQVVVCPLSSRLETLPVDPTSHLSTYLEYHEIAQAQMASTSLSQRFTNVCAPSPDLVLARTQPASWYDAVDILIPDARTRAWRPTACFRHAVNALLATPYLLPLDQHSGHHHHHRRLRASIVHRCLADPTIFASDASYEFRAAAIVYAARLRQYEIAETSLCGAIAGVACLSKVDAGLVFEIVRLSPRLLSVFKGTTAAAHLPTIDLVARREAVRLNSCPASCIDDHAVKLAVERFGYARALKLWASNSLRSNVSYARAIIPRVPEVYVHMTYHVRADRACALAFLRAMPRSIAAVPSATLLQQGVFFQITDHYRRAFYSSSASFSPPPAALSTPDASRCRLGLLGELPRRTLAKVFDAYFDKYPADLLLVEHTLSPTTQATERRISNALKAIESEPLLLRPDGARRAVPLSLSITNILADRFSHRADFARNILLGNVKYELPRDPDFIFCPSVFAEHPELTIALIEQYPHKISTLQASVFIHFAALSHRILPTARQALGLLPVVFCTSPHAPCSDTCGHHPRHHHATLAASRRMQPPSFAAATLPNLPSHPFLRNHHIPIDIARDRTRLAWPSAHLHSLRPHRHFLGPTPPGDTSPNAPDAPLSQYFVTVV